MTPRIQVTNDDPEVSGYDIVPILRTNRNEDHNGHYCGFLKSIRLEPVFFFFSVGDSVVSMIIQTYYIDRICRLNERFDDQVCRNLTNYPDYEKVIEKEASEYSMYQSLIESGFPILLALFLGPLTDKYGYRPLLLYPLFGYLSRSLAFVLYYFFPLLPPKYFLFASVPVGISGGSVTFVIGVYGFMSSQTDYTTRTFRLVILQATWEIGTVLGYLCGCMIFKHASFLPTFVYIFTFYGLSFIYTLTRVFEIKDEEAELLSSTQSSFCFKDLISLTPVKEMLHSCFKQRPGYGRMIIMIVVVGTSLQFMAYASRGNEYLFTRNMFSWDTEKYLEFSAFRTLINGFGSTFTSLVLVKLLCFRDANVLAITTISNLSAYFIYTMARQEWFMILGAFVHMFGTTTNGILQSVLSKNVHKDEYGKLISLVICAEFSMPFISGPLYTVLYIQMVTTFPGVIFLVAGLITAVVLVLVGILHYITKDGEDYGTMIEDS